VEHLTQVVVVELVDFLEVVLLAAPAALVLSSSDTYLQYKDSIPSQPLVL
jgi:hypothetical protein